MTVEEIRRENDNFPVGMRVLAVDDDPICLKLLETLLRKCQYHVTTTSQARMALKMLRENKDRFDLVISDVHMPDMDGFKLLELVGLEMDLPVIMLSANSDPKLVMKGVTHGACDYLVKPIRIEELRNIWQHVLRRKKLDARNQNDKSNDQVRAHQASGEGHGSPVAGNNDQNGKFNRKRKDEEDDNDDNENENEDPATQKKPRVVWSIELHRKFVGAVNQLGIEKAVPKRILDLMNVDGLTRENVASHLQKYRLYLKRISSVQSQQANMVAALGVRDSPFMRMGNSLDGLGDFRPLQQARLSNIALSSPFTSSNGMLGRLNSPSANINLRNLTQSSLVQPSHAQSLSNSITSLGKLNLILSPSTQNQGLFQGIPSSLELDQMQQNKGPTNFNTIDSLLNGAPNNQVMLQGIGNQSTHSMNSFNSEGFNVSGLSKFLDPLNTFEASSRMQPNPLISSSEPFHGHDSSNSSYLQNNPIDPFEDSREGLVGAVQRQNYPHSSGNGTFSSFNSSHVPGNGIVSPFVNGRLDGGASTTLMQQTENATMAAETRMRSSNEDFFSDQPKLQGGFVPQGYDSLDELMNAMIKREQDGTMSNCGFGFDDYSFGQGI